MSSIHDFGDDHNLSKVDCELFIDAMKEFRSCFLSTYRNFIREHYNEFYEKEPSYFPFMNAIEWRVVFNNRTIDNYLFESDSDSFDYVNHQFTTLGESRKFNRLPDYKKKEKIFQLLQKEEEHLEKITVKYGFPAPAIVTDDDYVTEDPRDMTLMGEVKGREYAELHGNLARKEKMERFCLFELEKYVPRVNNEQFEYEIGEAIVAFRQGLYLASAVTSAVSLETLLKQSIINSLPEDAIPKDTREKHTLNYASILFKSGKIDERIHHRIKSLNELRRSSAHSKTGKIEKWDAEQMLIGLRTIIEYIFPNRD